MLFFRLMEELLVQIHSLAMDSATFIETDHDLDSDSENDTVADPVIRSNAATDFDADSSRNTYDTLNISPGVESVDSEETNFPHLSRKWRKRQSGEDPNKTPDFTKVSMTLKPYDRDLLMARLKLAIAYAAAWGTGGLYNGSSFAKMFDHVVRDAIEEHIGTEVNIADNDGISIFSLALNLESVSMTPSMTVTPGKFGIPKSFENTHIECAMRQGELLFKNPSMVSTEACIRLLLASNAHVMLLGGRVVASLGLFRIYCMNLK